MARLEQDENGVASGTRVRDRLPWWLRRSPIVAAGAAGPVAVGAALVPVRAHISSATVALLLAATVTAIAATTSRLAAAVAGLSAAVSFDVFYTHPYGSLVITRAEDAEAAALLLVVAVLVGQLAARNRYHRRAAVEARINLGRVHGVAEMVAAGASTDDVVRAVESELRSLLRLRDCRFVPTFADRPGPFIERNGGVSWGGLRWGSTTLGLPSADVSLIVEHAGRPLGRFVLQRDQGGRVTEDELVAAVALADQAGAALSAHATAR